VAAEREGLQSEHRPRLRGTAHGRLVREVGPTTRALPLALLALLVVSAPAWAHDERFSASRVEIRAREILWTVDVGTAGVEKVVRLPGGEMTITAEQLQEAKADIVAYLLETLKVEINGKPVEGEAEALEPVYATWAVTGQKYISYARQHLRFRAKDDIKRVQLSSTLFQTVTKNHHAALIVSWAGAQKIYSRYGPFDLDLTVERIRPTVLGTGFEFLLWGMNHIFIGYDHISFLLALLLAARRLREMVRVVTSFTVAHSITLLLAALDVIRIPGAVTESLIAASIVYVAAENYFITQGSHRWMLTFAFGLVHGLGFSSVLRERLQDVESIIVPVVSFNLGVEVGQITILLIVLPVLTLIRRGPDEASRERRQWWLVRVGSLPILLLGAFWLVDRVFQLNLMPF
jgi:hydrogenase/urease accessory protein HupE